MLIGLYVKRKTYGSDIVQFSFSIFPVNSIEHFKLKNIVSRFASKYIL